MKEIELKGKFVIAFDTICEGNKCHFTEVNGKNIPTLYNSDDEAFREIFDDNYSMLKSHMEDGMLEEYNEGVTPEMILEMDKILDSGDVKAMRKFMDQHPECDDSGEFVQPADEFILGRKAIFGRSGLVIEGKKLGEI